MSFVPAGTRKSRRLGRNGLWEEEEEVSGGTFDYLIEDEGTYAPEPPPDPVYDPTLDPNYQGPIEPATYIEEPYMEPDYGWQGPVEPVYEDLGVYPGPLNPDLPFDPDSQGFEAEGVPPPWQTVASTYEEYVEQVASDNGYSAWELDPDLAPADAYPTDSFDGSDFFPNSLGWEEDGALRRLRIPQEIGDPEITALPWDDFSNITNPFVPYEPVNRDIPPPTDGLTFSERITGKAWDNPLGWEGPLNLATTGDAWQGPLQPEDARLAGLEGPLNPDALATPWTQGFRDMKYTDLVAETANQFSPNWGEAYPISPEEFDATRPKGLVETGLGYLGAATDAPLKYATAPLAAIELGLAGRTATGDARDGSYFGNLADILRDPIGSGEATRADANAGIASAIPGEAFDPLAVTAFETAINPLTWATAGGATGSTVGKALVPLSKAGTGGKVAARVAWEALDAGGMLGGPAAAVAGQAAIQIAQDQGIDDPLLLAGIGLIGGAAGGITAGGVETSIRSGAAEQAGRAVYTRAGDFVAPRIGPASLAATVTGGQLLAGPLTDAGTGLGIASNVASGALAYHLPRLIQAFDDADFSQVGPSIKAGAVKIGAASDKVTDWQAGLLQALGIKSSPELGGTEPFEDFMTGVSKAAVDPDITALDIARLERLTEAPKADAEGARALLELADTHKAVVAEVADDLDLAPEEAVAHLLADTDEGTVLREAVLDAVEGKSSAVPFEQQAVSDDAFAALFGGEAGLRGDLVQKPADTGVVIRGDDGRVLANTTGGGGSTIPPTGIGGDVPPPTDAGRFPNLFAALEQERQIRESGVAQQEIDAGRVKLDKDLGARRKAAADAGLRGRAMKDAVDFNEGGLRSTLADRSAVPANEWDDAYDAIDLNETLAAKGNTSVEGVKDALRKFQDTGDMEPGDWERIMEVLSPPKEYDPAVNATREAWQADNRALLDGLGDNRGKFETFVEVKAGGQLQSPYATELVRRADTLDNLLRKHMTREEAHEMARTDMMGELNRRYAGDVPEHIREQLDSSGWTSFGGREAANPHSKAVTDIISGGADVVRRVKNLAYGYDLGVFLQQGLASGVKGFVPLAIGAANKLNAKIHLPSMDVKSGLTDDLLDWETRQQLDGLKRNQHSGVAQTGEGSFNKVKEGEGFYEYEGSVLSYAPWLQKVDSKLAKGAQKMSNFQFNKVLGTVRTLVYEGNLIMAKGAGMDISDVAVRRVMAENANAITSAANTAVSKNRRNLETALLNTPTMRRAQINHLRQMTRILNGNGPERLAAATSIVSAATALTLAGYVLNEFVGTSEFEWDPREKDFGRVKWQDGTVDDLLPQDQIARALVKASVALKDADPKDAMRAFGDLGVTSASPLTAFVLGAANVGYKPERGVVYSGLTKDESGWGTAGRLASQLVGVPPILSGLVRGEYNTGNLARAARLALTNFLGGNSYFDEKHQPFHEFIKERPPVDPITKKPREIEDYKSLNFLQKKEIRGKYPELKPEGDPLLQPELDKFSEQRTNLANDFGGGTGTLGDWKKARHDNQIGQGALFNLKNFDGDTSKLPIEDQWYLKYNQMYADSEDERTGVTDFAKFNELEDAYWEEARVKFGEEGADNLKAYIRANAYEGDAAIEVEYQQALDRMEDLGYRDIQRYKAESDTPVETIAEWDRLVEQARENDDAYKDLSVASAARKYLTKDPEFLQKYGAVTPEQYRDVLKYGNKSEWTPEYRLFKENFPDLLAWTNDRLDINGIRKEQAQAKAARAKPRNPAIYATTDEEWFKLLEKYKD